MSEILLQADVALDVPGHDSFTYRVPEELRALLTVGDAVRVPLGPRRVQGFVIAIAERPAPDFVLRPIEERRDHCQLPPTLVALIRWAASYYRCSLGSFLAAAVPAPVRDAVQIRALRRVQQVPGFSGKLTPRQRQALATLPQETALLVADAARQAGCTVGVIERLIHAGALELAVETGVREHLLGAPHEGHRLTEEQQQAFEAIQAAIERRTFAPFLLYGVTGSGKTLVYMDLAALVIARGQQVILLLPEIALTPQLAARFRNRFERVVVWHSAFTGGERHEHWRRCRAGEVDLVIGTRSALFAPLPAIGLIVVDEEHDSSYKQDSAPRYQGRDLAVVYAQQLSVPVVLGTATPSAETIHNARSGRYAVLTLRQRPAGGRLPRPTVVDMRAECAAQQRHAHLSRALISALTQAHARGEQSIVLLNRRGWSPVVHCRSCGHTMQCGNCDVSLTYHKRPHLLRCHYCGHEGGLPAHCPACREPSLALHGIGTEQMAEALGAAVPGLRVLRLDADSVAERQGHAKVLAQFADGPFDCLLGTQMVAKGLNFPRVTVVGVIAADHSLSQPDFRAAERGYQLISQVAGRAGRGDQPGVVVVQAFEPEAASIQCAIHTRPKTFFDAELALRQRYGYPPHAGLVRIIWRGPSLSAVETLAQAHGQLLDACRGEAVLLGPSPAAIAFLKGFHRWHCLIKAGSRGAAQALLDRIDAAGGLRAKGAVQVAIDVDPYAFS